MKNLIGKNSALFLTVAIVAVLLGIFIQTGSDKSKASPVFEKLILLPTPRNINTTVFDSHLGEKTDANFFKGKWSILFFGFTNCPDICPTTLQTLKNVKRDLEQNKLWQNYQVIMVSVDPERDTPEQLAKYVPFFDSEFIGISADKAATTAFAKDVGVLFFATEKDEDGRYDVDHSASLILINPDGQWAGAITAPHKQDAITKDLIKLANYKGVNAYPVSTTKLQANQTSKPAQTSPGQEILIKNAWIRPAPPTASSMAAYFELVNNSDEDLKIVDSSSPEFEMTMIHSTQIEEDGIARMHHLDHLLIPSKGRVILEPLGKHMMLMQAIEPLGLGDTATIRLISDQGIEIVSEITVQQGQ